MGRWLVIASALALLAQGARAAAEPNRPNIILMLADDQGWNGTSVPMHPDVAGSKGAVFRTPNLEKLAAKGMRFSAAYAPAPVCSPTRISIQTGRSPAAMHWTKAAPPETGRKLIEPINVKALAPSEVTVGELLRSAGYRTAHYGKWHIRGGGPARHGYDESDGDTGNEEAFKYTDPNPVNIFGMVKSAAAFMDRSKKSGKPFYIQMSWNALHAAGNANKATLAKYRKLNLGNEKRMQVAAITEDLDTGVGALLKAIDDLGLTDTTYVIYTSDNGAGGGGRGALAGGKGDLFEGGIRVPFIVRGPGVKANSWCHTRIVGYDLLPTFCEWAGLSAGKIPRAVEGGSLAKVIAEGKGEVSRPREGLVFHFPHYQGDTPHAAIIVGNLKLIKFFEDNRLALYDLEKDLREQNDLAKKMPEQAAQRHRRLTDYLKAVDAQMPTPNPRYDPSTQPKKKKGGKGGKGGKDQL
ncbi:MAG: sulfatase [Gemmataceae bacterium]